MRPASLMSSARQNASNCAWHLTEGCCFFGSGHITEIVLTETTRCWHRWTPKATTPETWIPQYLRNYWQWIGKLASKLSQLESSLWYKINFKKNFHPFSHYSYCQCCTHIPQASHIQEHYTSAMQCLEMTGEVGWQFIWSGKDHYLHHSWVNCSMIHIH